VTLFCRLGWHRWTDAGGRVACRDCTAAPIAARPVQVRIVWWLLVGMVVVSVTRALAALAVRADVEAFATRWWPQNVYRLQITDARSVVDYSVFMGFTLAVVLLPLVLTLRGPFSWARWTVFGVVCVSLVAQVLYISSDVADFVVPGWYPLTEQLLELTLLAASGTVLVLLLHSSSGHYFDEGVGRRDAADDDFDRAMAAIRKRREA
jgi:hypothetical protein